MIVVTPPDRFWSKVRRGEPNECWLWQGTVTSVGGYGNVYEDSAHRGAKTCRQARAHRVAWTLTFGQIPEGKQVLHRCDVPLCCNPAHLFLGTGADNMADKQAKGRCASMPGESNPMAKLTWPKVREIRKQLSEGVPRKQIMARFKVCRRSLYDIERYRQWKEPIS